MNKVIIIHLNGQAYHLEEGGYEALRVYLDSAARQLQGNPDKDEIIADIEQAIADKCHNVLTANRTVVLTEDIEAIIAEMGPVDSGSSSPDEKKPAADEASRAHDTKASSASSGPAKRLYRINEGAMLGGVCNGIAAYFGIDVSIVRLAFLVLALVTVGTAALAYLAMTFIIPMADTSAEKAAAFGTPNTAQEFIKRAREGYYEGMKTWGDRHARREWKRKFKREMRGWRHTFHQQMNENAHQWQKNWHSHWAQHPQHWAGAAFLLPLVGLIRAVITLVWLFALISLLTTGAVFGLVLPVGLPWWITVLSLVILYQIVVWPLRAIRYSCWHSCYGPRHPLAAVWDIVVWTGFLVLLVWFADRYIPQAHEALMNLPAALHHAADAVKEWWNRK
jgi:phage shock protein PspC (stress-responsive transcriptional regulator)